LDANADFSAGARLKTRLGMARAFDGNAGGMPQIFDNLVGREEIRKVSTLS
jgi:hypothetical protein